jgi:hypothetical protein
MSYFVSALHTGSFLACHLACAVPHYGYLTLAEYINNSVAVETLRGLKKNIIKD